MFEPDGWHLRQLQFAGGHHTPMAGDDLALGVNQNRHVEAEGLDAARDLTNLPRAVRARVAWIELQFHQWPIDHCDRPEPIAVARCRVFLAVACLHEQILLPCLPTIMGTNCSY